MTHTPDVAVASDDLDKAVERLTKALDIATKYTGGMAFGEGDGGVLSFADLRTLLTALSAKDAELAKAREALRVVFPLVRATYTSGHPVIPEIAEILGADQ